MPLTECRNPSGAMSTATLTTSAPESAHDGDRTLAQLSLLGGFSLVIGDRRCSLPQGSERLVALLAVRPRGLRRGAISGTLWPESDDLRASAALRSTLTRLRRIGRTIVDSGSGVLGLGKDVDVDISGARGLAERAIQGKMLATDLATTSIATLSFDLLPGWYEDWVILEAEDWRQVRLHALESLSATLTQKGRFAHAISAAMAAIRGDPWRESARQALVRTHLAENNQSEAIREFDRYRNLLKGELGLEPSRDFVRLVGGRESLRRCDAGRNRQWK